MPKKKLTKAQVKRKLKTINNALYDLFLDKVAYRGDSGIAISVKKLDETMLLIDRSKRRVK